MVKLTISLDEGEANGYLRRAARALSRRYRMPGFRPGKAPYNVVVRRLGIESVQAQALDQFGDEVYQKGLEEAQIDPVNQASLDDVTWDPFSLHLTVSVAPEVDLGAYREVRVPWKEPEVTDEQIEEALLNMRKEQREWTAEERPAEAGDQVVLDIRATVDDQVVLENVGRELVLSLDSPFPVPGFAAAVLGMTPGEDREFDLPYPEDHYNADIAGKMGHFSVHLNEIHVESLPELDDEFAMSVGDYESLEDLKTRLWASLMEEAREAAERDYEEQLWARLLEVARVEYPDVYLEREMEAQKSRIEDQLKQQGLDLVTYFQLSNTTEEAWREQMLPQVEERLRRTLILAKVIEDWEIQVDAQDIDAEIERTVEPLGQRADEFREMLNSADGRVSIAESVLSRKAMDLLKAIARGELEEAVEDQVLEAGAEEAAEGQEEAAESQASETEAEETAEADAAVGDTPAEDVVAPEPEPSAVEDDADPE